MRNHSYDLHQPTDSFHDNQTHFYMKGFTQRLVLKQRHKDAFIHELLTRAFDSLCFGPEFIRCLRQCTIAVLLIMALQQITLLRKGV